MELVFIVILCVAFTEALVFKCNFEVQTWTTVGTLYSCNNPLIMSYEVKKTLELVVGIHEGSNGNIDVGALSIRDQELTEIPPNMNTFFPNLKAILLYTTNLRTISPDDLDFPLLEYFSSINNQIQSIDGELFKNTPRLKTISFYKNSLDHVGDNVFKGLNDLTHVDLRENICVDAWSWTAAQLEELNVKLVNQCKCSNSCSLGDEVSELNFIVDEFSKRLKELLEENSKQNEKIVKMSEENKEILKQNDVTKAIADNKFHEIEEKVNQLSQIHCEAVSINFSTTLKIIFIVFVSIISVAVLLVVVIFLYRKCIVKADKPTSGNIHKLVISRT